MRITSRIAATSCALALSTAFVAHAGVPMPTAATPKATDAGQVAPQAISVTIALKLRDAAGAESLLQSMYTPGDPAFQQFLTPDQFRARFAPTDADVARVAQSFARFGVSVERASTTTLVATGTPAQLQQAFQVSLRHYHVAAHGNTPGYTYRAALAQPTIPTDVAPLVHGVLGLSTRPQFRPHRMQSLTKIGKAAVQLTPAKATDGGNTSGTLTVLDFARLYNVTALYDKGVKGAGKTIGIVTLASFTPSDAFAYWQSLGLDVAANRIKVVDIDGGPGAPSDVSGSDETTLDVEQSGGLAPAAKIIVYQAPNTSQGFVDAFAKAVDANTADAISTSWGEWEWLDDKDNSPVTDPSTGRTVGSLRAMHEIFLQAALQGQSLFAASGDSGAYDVNDFGVPPDLSLTLSVDSPASDPLITAAGGTTLPGKQTFSLGPNTKPIVVDIKKERVWSWDYLVPLCDALGQDPISCGIFPVGSGGGVSIIHPRPFYQFLLDGVKNSEPGQVLVDGTVSPPQVIFKLPAHFPGRNVPDISANADPDTGYSLFYTSDRSGFDIETFGGGTSFVAPQLAGVTVLMGESLHGRVGLLNIPLYLLAHTGGYAGRNPPLIAIKPGNNDFYEGSNGYNPAAGLGVLDVGAFTSELKKFFRR